MTVPIRYLSVCSGIEAATQAWHPLGWQPVAFSEIEPYPSAALAHHYPDVPNWGDMTKFKDWPDAAIDLLCGGTPCQDYSIAGQRLGMAGARGQLTLTFVEIAARYRPRWLVWENVPGVLSSNGGRDFARFLGDLTGQSVSVPDGGWKSAGIIPGIGDAYGVAYRVLDAQFTRTRRLPFAVPQRRRRVFVVGYIGDWRRTAAVLLDPESLRGDPAPRRKTGQGSTRGFECGPQGGGITDVAPTLDTRCKDGPIRNQLGAGVVHANSGDIGYCLTASAQQSLDAETETLIAVAHTLRGIGFSAGEDGTGRSTPIVPVAFDCKGTEVQTATDGSHPTLRSMGRNHSHQSAGGHAAVAFDMRGRDGGAMPEGPHDTANIRAASGGSSRSYVAQPWAVRRLTPRECERLQGFPDDFTKIPGGSKGGWREVDETEDIEELREFGMPLREKGNVWMVKDPDGPRYKAIGNSWAVNVADLIGARIAAVDAILEGKE